MLKRGGENLTSTLMNISDLASSTTGGTGVSSSDQSTPKRRKTDGQDVGDHPAGERLRLPGSNQTTPIKAVPDRILSNPELANPERFLELNNEDVTVLHLLEARFLEPGDIIDDANDRRGRVLGNGTIVVDGIVVPEVDWTRSVVLNIGWRASSFPQKLGIALVDLRRTFIGLVREYAENNSLPCNLEDEDDEDEGDEEEEERNDEEEEDNNEANDDGNDSDSTPTQKSGYHLRNDQ